MQAGVQYVGEQPDFDPEDDFAIAAFNLLSNGMGGIDWSGLEIVAVKLGIDDIEGLIDRLHIIRTHKSPLEDRKHDD